jgi:hypothetical protein
LTITDRISGGEIVQLKSSFISDNIKFQLSDLTIMQNVEVGYILEVVGWVRGKSREGICVTGCWVRGVSDDLGNNTQIRWGY